ncbi:hypothetical protein SNEBB_000206, partial [Seison nebaliae]
FEITEDLLNRDVQNTLEKSLSEELSDKENMEKVNSYSNMEKHIDDMSKKCSVLQLGDATVQTDEWKPSEKNGQDSDKLIEDLTNKVRKREYQLFMLHEKYKKLKEECQK